jgi:hypothetical protein
MTHKEEMDYLKKHDPITYYEMTSDPCGSGNSDSIGVEIFLVVVVIIAIIFIFI